MATEADVELDFGGKESSTINYDSSSDASSDASSDSSSDCSADCNTDFEGQFDFKSLPTELQTMIVETCASLPPSGCSFLTTKISSVPYTRCL